MSETTVRRGRPLQVESDVANLQAEVIARVAEQRIFAKEVETATGRVLLLLQADRPSDAYQVAAGLRVEAGRRLRQCEEAA